MSLRSFSAIVIVALLAPAGTSMAQTPSDPSAGSPAGTVYELPVDKGRGDAAPGGKDGSGGGPAGPLGTGSLYRSENNFGTSARVPGAPRDLLPDDDEDDVALDQASASGDPGSGNGDVSESGAIALLALLGAGGIGIGFLSRRSWS